ncbi:MOSC domain-containing protein [Amycolatopsis regifaucium]|uniref:MOSC domain-containing protein n=1 Tax=Amycolatopsis regifaucium TaxID=546365 RepID=A0A154MLK3_9PSEU|nr:molybdenum cofactor sulfurase [Amycolatopsis regifaucium]OKA04171.1 MOSC domain-containing protein [Amycolatopsis regifaucium]
MARVARLVYYPVKGCAGTSVDTADVTPAGLQFDRAWMVVSPEGEFRSQRKHPVMASIRADVLDGGARLRLAAPGVEDLLVETVTDGPRQPASTFTWQGKGVHQGAEAADWFSEVLGLPSVFVGLAPEHERVTNGEIPGTAAFADAHAILLTSESSLDGLNERIASRGAEAVPMDRFRPNIVVAGWPEPHREDEVRSLSVGGVELGYAKVCIRCTVPMVDQETGRKAGPEPIRSLADYRREPEGGVSFGIKMAVTRPGQLAVGDEVIVHS